jgi:peptidoglycan-associated lipoprotein
MLASVALNVAPSAFASDALQDHPTASELFTDGMDAAADHANDSARRIFAELIANYPGSPEALRARHVLATLDNGEESEEHQAVEADEAERTSKYRRAFLVDVGDRVFFAESSATIGGRARSIIENQARWLKARPALTVTVIGRADDGGSRGAALALSRQRAEAVRDRLIAGGIDAGRIAIRAVGDKDRIALCKTPLCEAQNRNSEVLIDALRGASVSEGDMRRAATPLPRLPGGAGR